MNSNQSEKLFTFEQDDLLTKSMSILQDLRKTGLFCDVVVKAGNREFPANRNILAATVPYFYTMFTSKYMESKQKEVILKEIDPLALEALIGFSYSGKIQIDPQNVKILMIAADFLQLSKVKLACADFLTSEIQDETVFKIKKLANVLNCQSLVSAANEFVNENFSTIIETKEFLMLEFEEILELIGKSDITCLEEIVFEAAMQWVKHKEAERISHLPDILSKVRLSLVSTEYLVNVVSTEELIMSSFECLRIVDKAKSNHLMQCEKRLIHKSRNLTKFNYFVPTIAESQLRIYDVLKNEWLNEPLNKNRLTSAVVQLGSKIYVIGGNDNYAHNMDFYDLQTKNWSKGKNTFNGRYNMGATSLNNCIYVCGGETKANYLSNVECYSVKKNSWKVVAPMLTERKDMGVTSLNGSIYVIGGCNIIRLNSCEKYDPTSNTWTNIKPLSCERDDPGVVTFNNKIYVCGGYHNDSLNSCEVYDLSTNTWSNIASMNVSRYRHSMASINGKLYAVGGCSGKVDVFSVEIYSPETNSWELLNHD